MSSSYRLGNNLFLRRMSSRLITLSFIDLSSLNRSADRVDLSTRSRWRVEYDDQYSRLHWSVSKITLIARSAFKTLIPQSVSRIASISLNHRSNRHQVNATYDSLWVLIRTMMETDWRNPGNWDCPIPLIEPQSVAESILVKDYCISSGFHKRSV